MRSAFPGNRGAVPQRNENPPNITGAFARATAPPPGGVPAGKKFVFGKKVRYLCELSSAYSHHRSKLLLQFMYNSNRRKVQVSNLLPRKIRRLGGSNSTHQVLRGRIVHPYQRQRKYRSLSKLRTAQSSRNHFLVTIL